MPSAKQAETEEKHKHKSKAAEEEPDQIDERPPAGEEGQNAGSATKDFDLTGGPTAAGSAPQAVHYATPFKFHGSEHTEAGRVYRLAEKSDCYAFRCFADSLDGFTLRHNKDEVLAWDKKIPNEPMHVIKVFGVFHDTQPRELYDMLQDSVFREEWDTFRQEAFRITKLNAYNDIGYYAGKSPVALVANRDFVNQRMWHDTGRGEYVIFNTSVPHADVPITYQKDKYKNKHGTYVRAISKLTGYLIQPWTNPETGAVEGTSLTYVTQTDPCGWIPKALTNFITSKYAPKTIANVGNALKQFKTWFPEHLASGTYEKDWDDGVVPSWWFSAADEASHPVKNETIECARDLWKAKEAKKKKK